MSQLASATENAPAIFVPKPVKRLDNRSDSAVREYVPGERVSMWAATISAGYKDGNIPRVVRNKKIFLHEDTGDAPGIRDALGKTDNKDLTISMLSDDIEKCITQLFVCYDKVKIFGDENQLTTIEFKGETQTRKTLLVGTPEYEEARKRCKVQAFLYFGLAEWDANNVPFMSFPDGLLPYRLRTTSGNSIDSILDCLVEIQKITHGHLAGVPLTLSIGDKNVLTPDGSRRVVPVWKLVLKHPEGLKMRSQDVARVLTSGIKDAAQLALPASIDLSSDEVMESVVAHDEAIEAVESEIAETVESNRATVHRVTTGERAERRKADYFKITQNTPYTEDANRARLIQRAANAALVSLREPSLRELCEVATEDEWQCCTLIFCKVAAEFLGTEEAKPAKATVADEDPYADAPAADVPAAEVVDAEFTEDPKPEDHAPTADQTPTQEAPRSYTEAERREQQAAAEEIVKNNGWSGNDYKAVWDRIKDSAKKGGLYWPLELLIAVEKNGVDTLAGVAAAIESKAAGAQEKLL